MTARIDHAEPANAPGLTSLATPAGRWRGAGRALERYAATTGVLPLSLAALTFVVFAPALRNSFVEWDDYINLFHNAHYRGLGWPQIRWMFTSTLMGHYIPVTWLSFGLDYTLWGMKPLGYHLTNNLIHSANAVLFYLVALKLLAKGTALSGSALRLGSAFATLFFALHPLRAESVAWATERRDVLSGFFFLLTILAHLAAVDANGPRRRRLRLASLACFVLSLLSKSIVMTVPLILVLLDFYPLKRLPLRWSAWRRPATRAVLAEKLPYFLVGIAGAAGSFYAVAFNNFFTPIGKYGLASRISITGYSVWFYFEKTFVPTALSPLHELPAAVNPFDFRFLLPAVAVIVVSLLVLALSWRWPAGLAVWIYYGIVLGPVVGIAHAGHQLTHDRYSYLSCLGWALLVGAAFGRLGQAAARGEIRLGVARAGAAVAAAWLLALGVLTWYQVQIWRDTETLWRYAVEAEPECAICQSNLGLALFRRNLFLLAKEKFELALALRPDRTLWHGNLGLVLQSMGDFDLAMTHYQKALASNPNDPDTLTNMAVGLMSRGRHAEALAPLERANHFNPGYAPALINLGAAHIETGHPNKALAFLVQAREMRPEEPVLHVNFSRAYLALGQYELAYHEYATVARLDPEAARRIEPAFFSVW